MVIPSNAEEGTTIVDVIDEVLDRGLEVQAPIEVEGEVRRWLK